MQHRRNEIREISTHAPAGGATDSGREHCPVLHYFYSRPCGRGDGCAICCVERGEWISTHAPAGGATRAKERNILFLCISTHAPAGGATGDARQGAACGGISTHAPAGGATVDGALDRKNLPNFYSRPCGRGDGYAGLYQVLHADDFYSRPCGRGDGLHACEQPIDVLISTHAPAGGATSSSLSSRHSRSVFLLTPLREGRRGYSFKRPEYHQFLLTPLREGRQQFSTSPS